MRAGRRAHQPVDGTQPLPPVGGPQPGPGQRQTFPTMVTDPAWECESWGGGMVVTGQATACKGAPCTRGHTLSRAPTCSPAMRGTWQGSLLGWNHPRGHVWNIVVRPASSYSPLSAGQGPGSREGSALVWEGPTPTAGGSFSIYIGPSGWSASAGQDEPPGALSAPSHPHFSSHPDPHGVPRSTGQGVPWGEGGGVCP